MSTTDTDVRPRLEEWADVREGSAADEVGGVPARFVVAPADQAAVAAVLRTAYEHGLAVVPTGSGTKLSWGAAPERVDVLLDLSRLDRLVEHAAGDLIAVVASGRRLDALQADLASAGQWLAVDPPRGGTIGGLVATATSGPTRLLHGPVRDLVIGTTMVRADGVVARSGGKVVKNVAGYDLGKLVSGSYGTLGVLTEVAVRLHPLP
jgi:glycolate oxidase FAD binding subunit